MTIPNISTNALVDQTQLNQIIDTVNGISTKFANTISPIYSTIDKKTVNSYMGTFAIATNFVEDSISNGKAGYNEGTVKAISFNKTFAAPPLVFASITVGGSGNYIGTVQVSDVNQSGCTVQGRIWAENAFRDAKLGFTVSILAIGLTVL